MDPNAQGRGLSGEEVERLSRYVTSKWKKTAALRKVGQLDRCIPETKRMSKSGLKRMLDRYGMVYVKPEKGMWGKGVMRVERLGSGYRYQLGTRVSDHGTYDSMYAALLKDTKRRKYLVQRGINLLKYNGRRFDLRVMAQLSPAGTWETTGIIGRVAGKQKVVTNVHNGGELVPAERLLAPHAGSVNGKLKSLAELGVLTGRTMRNAFPGVYKVGLDIAMDATLKPWILEVNTKPDPYIFRNLPDKSIYRKVMRYEKAYLAR